MDIARKNYAGLPAPGAPHFHSVRMGNLLFLSGATARDTEAEYGDMAEQTEVILKRMKLILEAEAAHYRTSQRLPASSPRSTARLEPRPTRCACATSATTCLPLPGCKSPVWWRPISRLR